PVRRTGLSIGSQSRGSWLRWALNSVQLSCFRDGPTTEGQSFSFTHAASLSSLNTSAVTPLMQSSRPNSVGKSSSQVVGSFVSFGTSLIYSPRSDPSPAPGKTSHTISFWHSDAVLRLLTSSCANSSGWALM